MANKGCKMRMVVGALAGVVCAPAFGAEYLPTHPRNPWAEIFEHGGFGTENAFARARVLRGEAESWCANWRPAADSAICSEEIISAEEERVYEARANCQTGEIVDHFGNFYVYDGLWTAAENDMWAGHERFREAESGNIVSTVNAAGGLVIAGQWSILCPYGAPYDLQPLKQVMDDEDHSGNMELVWHNGSGMRLDYERGTITYGDPKDSLAGLVETGTVLFRGTIVSQGVVSGMAFTFKRGCDPAPYRVWGEFDSKSDKLVLTGAAPVRDGCEVTGYSGASPNGRLVFDLPHH